MFDYSELYEKLSEDEIDNETADPEDKCDPELLKILHDLLKLCQEKYPAPKSVILCYTIGVIWDSLRIFICPNEVRIYYKEVLMREQNTFAENIFLYIQKYLDVEN